MKNKGITSTNILIIVAVILGLSVIGGLGYMAYQNWFGETKLTAEDYTTQSACKEANYYWYNGACHNTRLSSEEISLKHKKYRRKVTINKLGNNKPLKNFQVSLNLDTLSLIEQGKLSLNCGNISFRELDGDTIPYWMKGKCGRKDTEFWINIPKIAPHKKKSFYIYYGNKERASASNYSKTFGKTSNSLKGWYYLNNLSSTTIPDFSDGDDQGKLYGLPQLMSYSYPAESQTVVFSNWQRSWEQRNTYFEIPKEQMNFDKSEGTIEMWIKPKEELSQLCAEECPPRYQRIFIDSNWQMELGIDPNDNLYFYPAQAPQKNYNMIDNPLKNDEWNHLVVAWDYKSKNVNFYINGERKKSEIDNVSRYWEEVAQTGNWQFGGTNLDINSYFTGLIDGMRIYDKALGGEEVEIAYRQNSKEARFPEFSLGKEKLLSTKAATERSFKPSLVNDMNITNRIVLNPYYCATPREDSYRYHYPSEKVYSNPSTDEELFLVSKRKEDWVPIFGVPSHFFPYEGAPVKAQDSFLLTHVGLKINNPDLVKDLKVEFKRVKDDRLRGQLLEKLLPVAHACGPFYSYKITGSSTLSLAKEEKGVYWYKLKKPVYVNREATMFQLYYKPAGREGKFSVKTGDMIFVDEDHQYVRASFSKSLQQKDIPDYFSTSEKYRSFIAKEEKGSLNFKQNSQSKDVVVSIENRGEDPIKIDEKSIRNIEYKTIDQRVNSIKIQDEEGNVASKVLMEEVKNKILGEEIKPKESIEIILLPFKKIDKDKNYYVTIGTEEVSGGKESINSRRIIKWFLGKDPYYYPQRSGNTLYFYNLNVDQQNNIHFEEIDRRN